MVLLLTDLDPANPQVTHTAAVALLMAVWWLTEAIPIPATALLPMVLFPLLGIMNGNKVAAEYFNHIIFLFVGGFIVALAMQKWNLHRRIALRTMLLTGSSPRRVLLGFMLATAFLSMWISNTATTMMIVPIALAVIMQLRESSDTSASGRFAVGLLLGIAYSASVGGLATLIGTPPNLAFARILTTTFPEAPEITFAQWMLFALPVSVIFLALIWWLLGFMYARGSHVRLKPDAFRTQLKELGPMSYEEKAVSLLFAILALLWLTRADIVISEFTIPGWSNLFPEPKFINDGVVAIIIAVVLFLIPSKSKPGERLIDWETAQQLNWGIVILFGGGFALAAGFRESGLSVWIAQQLSWLGEVHPIFTVSGVSTLLTFLTELTSNTATTQIVLPLLGSLAVATHTNPLLLMIPATLSASCAFMLPVATPPNAIIFGTGEVKMSDMVRVGIILNLLGVVIITALMFILGLVVFGIDLSHLPTWAG